MGTPTKLDNGDILPTITARVVDDGEMTLPGDLEGSWVLVVFYRGHW